MSLVPIVIEKTPNGERSYDIFSRLLRERIVMLTGEVNDHTVNLLIAQMLFLEAEDPNAEIAFYINSPGGSVSAGMALVDTMAFLKCDIRTIVNGQACSMGSMLAACGTKGKRMMLPNSYHMIHQVLAGYSGQASDLEIHTAWTLRWKRVLNDKYVEVTGQPYEKVLADTDRDNFMSAQESITYGLADEIIKPRKA